MTMRKAMMSEHTSSRQNNNDCRLGPSKSRITKTQTTSTTSKSFTLTTSSKIHDVPVSFIVKDVLRVVKGKKGRPTELEVEVRHRDIGAHVDRRR